LALIHKSTLTGIGKIPPSKSQTLRALVFATLAQGTSLIKNYLHSPDTTAMIQACRLLGAQIREFPDELEVKGGLHPAENVIDVGNSGITFRFITALGALLPEYTIVTGDHSIRHRRIVKPLLEGLAQLGAFAVSSRGDGFAPVIVKGPLKGGTALIEGADSQPVSALLIASSFSPCKTEIFVTNPGEKPWINLTLSWFDRLGIAYENYDFERYILCENSSIQRFEYTVPADWSSALYPIVAAIITGSVLTLEGLDFSDPQGDKAVIELLQKLGAKIEVDSLYHRLTVLPGSCLQGGVIDIDPFIDAITLLPVMACFAQDKTTFVGGAMARHKECDRITAIVTELKKMGATIEQRPDGMVVEPSRLVGAKTESYADHRMVMSLAVAGLAAQGKTQICDTGIVAKSFPGFFDFLRKLGAQIEYGSKLDLSNI
jgi:3-phosphoshikimate 1-carboxyvinyltransferase